MDKESLYKDLLEFLNSSKLRKVPGQFIYSNPIANLFIILGAALSAMMICMTVIFFILHTKGLLHTRGLVRESVSHYIIFFPAILSIPFIFLLLYGIVNRRKMVKYLVNGDIAKGLVLSVSPLAVRINSRTFFEIKVRYASSQKECVTKDVVDNWAMEYFLNARDNKTMVDVLFLPDHPKKVLLIYKIAATKHFD